MLTVLGRWKEQPGRFWKRGLVIGLVLLVIAGGCFYCWKKWSRIATRRILVERVEEISGAVNGF